MILLSYGYKNLFANNFYARGSSILKYSAVLEFELIDVEVYDDSLFKVILL